MKPSIEKLQKFFKLEADRDYDNKAVMGGLARMLDAWIADARVDQIPEELIQSVSSRLKDYDHLSEASRKDALHGLWRRIQRELGGGDPPRKDEPEPPSPPPDPEPDPEPESTDEPETTPAPEAAMEQTKSEAELPSKEEKPTQTPEPEQRPEEPPAALNADVTVLPRVGPRFAKTLERLNIRTLGDMLYHFPRRYDDYSQLKPINRLQYGEDVTVIGTVQSIHSRTIRGGRSSLTEAVIHDGTAALRLTWFNQPWITKNLKKETQIVFSGKVEQYLGRLTINTPEWEPIEHKHLHTNRIVPIYPLTSRITQRWLRNLMFKVVNYWASRVMDPMPSLVLQNADLMDLPTALRQTHFPDSWEQLKTARHRLAFDEIFLLQLGVLQQKRSWQERTARIFEVSDKWLNEQLTHLPFELTSAQGRVLSDIRKDLSSGHPMNRLVQGDVGSGKTIVAAMAVAMINSQSAQAALMAPTSILAEQHFQNLSDLLTGENRSLQINQVRLMVGATPEAEKREIRDGLASGLIKFIIGTHALIEDPVEFANLELAIIDEQHRFGVKQRAALRSKGTNPHL